MLLLDLPASLSLRLVDTRWRVVPPGRGQADVVVAPVESVPDPRAVQGRCASALVLAVLPAAPDGGLVVALLGAGPSACVRGSSADGVAAHLAALTRRLRVAAWAS